MRREDFDIRLDALKRLTLMAGTENKIIPASFRKRFSKEIIGSRLTIQCVHMPQVECGAEFNASLLEFLGGDSQQHLRLVEDHNLTQRLLLR